MDNLNEITLSFATLLSPAFIAYVLYGKIKNKDINSSTSLPVIISLVALDFIILGIVNLQLFFIDFFAEMTNITFPVIFDKEIYPIIVTTLLLSALFFLFFPFKNLKINSKRFTIFLVLIFLTYLLTIFKDTEVIRPLFILDINVVELGYSNQKIYINPLAILVHTLYGLFILYALDTKVIPELRNKNNFFNKKRR